MAFASSSSTQDSDSQKMDMESGHHSKRRRSGEKEELSLKLSDKSVLECPFCFRPLTIPVFQCCNGHTFCKLCLGSLKSKRCPSCSELGNLPNRAMEKVLLSAMVSCSNKASGCSAEFSYSTKLSHEQTCAYAPYDCPFKGCTFLGSQPKLYLHLNQQHTSSVIPLKSSFSTFCHVDFCLSKADEVVVFLEKANEGAIFILNPRTMGICSIIEPSLSKVLGFRYSLSVEHKSGSFDFKRDTRPWRNADAVAAGMSADSVNSKDLLPVLDPFFDHDGRIRLRINLYCYYNR